MHNQPSSGGHTHTGESKWLCFPFVLPVATNKPFHSARWKDAVAEPMGFHTQAAIVLKRKLVTLSLFWLFFVSVPVSIHTSQERRHVIDARLSLWWGLFLSFKVQMENGSSRLNTRKPRAGTLNEENNTPHFLTRFCTVPDLWTLCGKEQFD